MPQALPVSYFRLIVTNTTGTSDTYLTVDKLKLYDSQISACSGTCASGTKFCSPDGTSSVCCTASQYFIPGVSTACTNCPANSAADLVYQERCVANAGYFGPTLYMFDGSQGSYQNLGSKTSHTVTPVGWRPTFGSVGSRYGAYFDSSVNGNYYQVVNDYNTLTLAFWMYLIGPYDAGTVARFEPMSMRSNQALADPRGFNLDLGRTAAGTGVGVFYVYYGTLAAYAMTAANIFPVTTWLHVVLVIPSGTDRLQRIYVNGVKQATRPNDSPTQDVLKYQQLLVAANVLDSRYYKGYLQQLTMYNYAMSDAEVTALYNSGTPNVFVACSSTCPTGLIRHCLITGATVCCPPGTFFREETDTACQSCPAGTFSGTSASSCTLCPSGTFSLRSSQILASACQSCPNNSTSNSTRTGCVANTGFYNLDANLLAYYPFRPENIYADASYSGYGLINTNGASFKPQTEYNTAPFQGAGVAYFNNAGAGMSGVTVTSATGSEVQSFQVPATAWTLASYVGTSSAPGAGFSWCYWIRGADGPTAGTLNTVQYPFVSWLGTCFCNAANAAFSGFYDGRNSADANGGGGTNYWIKGVAKSGVGPSGVYTRYWQHVCFTWQGTTFRAYVNCASSTCSASASTTLTAEVFSDTLTNVYIAQGGYGTAWFGWLSDFRYYKKALTPAEVFAVRSYSGTTSFSVNGDSSLLAYYPFKSSNIYADASGNGYNLVATNAAYPPASDSSTAPFTGAGVVLLDNNNVLGLASTARSFTITMGAGMNLGAMFGTQSTPNPGFSFCGWYRAKDGPTAGTVNAVNQFQTLIAILSHPANTSPSQNILRYFSVYRYGVSTGMTTAVRFNDPAITPESTQTTDGKYQNVWTHYCAAGYGRTINIYFDCGSRTCVPTVLSLSNDVYNMQYQYGYIGADFDPPWYGWLSEFRLYKRALTAAEVFAIKSYDGTSPTAVNSVNAGLLAYYPFQPNAFLVDASGVTGSLTNTGSVVSQPGSQTDLQNVAYFSQPGGLGNTNANKQYLTIPSITIGPYFSICLWYNPDSTSGNCPRLIELSNGATNSDNIQLRRDSTNNNLVVEMRNAATYLFSATPVYTGAFQLGVWQHVCMTVSGTAGNLYYNSVLQTSTPANTFTLNAQKTVTTYTGTMVGNTPYAFDLYRGQLDELRIYSRAISASEVTSIYNFRGDTYTPAIIVQCPPCSAGSYGGCTSGGTATCTNCPAGTYSTGTGLLTSGDCASCQAGSYATATGVTACTNCPANSWSTGGTSKCTANVGYYNLDDSTNLKAYYTFNPGALLQDVTGTTGSLTASASSPTAQASGPFGASSNSAFMTGSASTSPSSNQYFSVPSLTLPDSVSICSWFWISPSITRNWNRIWDFGNGASSSNVLGAIYYNTNNFGVDVYRGSTSIGNRAVTNGALETSTWKHACMTLSGTSQVVWINGVSTSYTMTNTRDPSVQLTVNYLGRSNWAADLYWYGAIDEFRIYYKTLTSTEVAALYAFRGDTYVPMIMLACPNPCGAGTYGGCTASGAQSCTGCPAGSYSTGVGVLTSAGCASCAAGTFKSTTGASVCDLCPAGKYSATVGAVTDPCLSCSAGTYSTGSGVTVSSVCLLCVAGTYSVTLAATSSGTCTACVAGTYSGVSGATISSTCTACAAGTYSGTTGASSSATCTACVAGTYSGTTGASSSATCTACPAGKYSGASAATVSSACTNCPAGTYSGTTGASLSSACTSCPAGTYSGTTGASLSSVCTSCPAGTYSGASLSSACTSCPTGTYSGTTGASLSSVCTSCPAGTYSGTTGASLSSVCTPCSAGKYSGTAGASSSATCTSCPAGTYSGATGASLSSACTACVAGTYSGVTGASSSATCTACAAGTYSALPGATAVATCSNCPAGTYQTGAGFTSIANCSLCQAGTYSVVLAATSSATCTACTGGSFSSSAGASVANACQTCSNGYFSLSGASVCSACAAGSYGGGAGITGCPLCSAGQYSTGLGLLVCTACSAGTFSITQGSTTPLDCQTCAAGTYASVAGQTSCVSCASLGTVCAADSTLRCPLNQSTPLCCGKNQFFREGVDLACQNCPVATFSMDGAGTACGACLTSPIGYRKWTNEPFPAAETSYDVGDYKVLAFTNEQYPYGGPYVTFGQDVDATFLIIGAGASGGSQWGGGGGAGAVMFMPQWRFPAGSDYNIQAGVGGYPNGPYGDHSYIGKQTFAYMSVMGGGQGGGWPGDKANKAGMGGSGGGGGACNTTYCSTRPFGPVNPDNYINFLWLGNNPALTKYVLGNVGGYGSLLNDGGTAQIRNGLHGGGGGGAGSPGESETAWTSSCASNNQAACGRCGNGGDGVAGITIDGVFYNFSTVFGSAYTKRAKGGYVAGGGGGGGYSSYGVIKCKGGLGGGGAGYQWSGSTLYTAENGAVGTGSGGGGASDFTTRTYGGSGLVLIKMSRICVCPGGMYAGTDGCASCAAGTYMTGTGQLSSAACLACAAGSYSSFAGASNCSACDAGKYLTYAGASSSMECLACDAGTYQSNTGVNTSAGCTACDAGKYSVNPGASLSSTCVGCPAGSYGLTPGASSSDFCTLCAAGTYGLTVGGSQAGVCLLCPAGTYSATTGASLANTCGSCPAGTYSGVQGRTDACDSCPAGTYSGATGASLLSTCQACSAGSYSPTLGATLSSTCQSCQAGTFQTGTGMDSSLACTACGAGFYSTGVGMQSSLACITCSAGTYQTGTGLQASVSCTSCSAGQYSTASGATIASTCQLCSAGTYFTGTGLQASASCSSCSAGQYSTASGATIASTCQLCSTGTFSTAIGASSVITCTACAAGTYANTAGSTVCTSCSSGLGACAAGTFPRCWANASFFSCCGPKQFFRENTDTACQTCTLGGTGGDGSGTACTACTYGLVTVTGATTYSDVLNSRVYQFKASGSAVFSRTMNADVLLVGGGGAGGSAIGGGGGAGTLIFASSTTFPGTSHTVTVGTGGVKGSNNVRGGSGVASSIGTLFSAAGGGGGGAWSNSLATNGGSGGGGGACGGCSSTPGSVATTSIVFGISGIATSSNAFGFSGGSGSTINAGTAQINNRLHGAGGGGAGAVGGNEVAGTSSCSSSNVAACGNCGAGGNGVSGVSISSQLFNFASVFGTAYTGVASSGFIAGGGGGGAFGSFTYPSNTCSGGAGGGGNGYRGTSRASSDNGLANTGSGGGGGADNSPGGNGGTGLVLLRVAVGTCVCGSGTFIATDGCASCAAGTYGTGDGFSSCVACASGKYSTGTGMGLLGDCTDCPAGTYSGGTGVSSSASCALCSAGSYSGTTGSTSIATCTACSAGYFSTGSGFTSVASCQICSAGTYGLTTGLSACTSCSAGTYSVTVGASLASTCQLCQAGTFQTGTGMQSSLACAACSAGSYATGLGFTVASNCSACSAGTYGLTSGLTACASCSAGTYSVTIGASFSSTCQLCQAGTFQTGTGMQSSLACTACDAGYYATGIGLALASNCTACTAGTYGLTAGLTICTSCSAGTYSEATAATSASTCQLCPAGTYSGAVGASMSSACLSCSAGYYSAGSGLTTASVCQACTVCVPGKYRTVVCTAARNSECTDCQAVISSARKYPPVATNLSNSMAITTFLQQSAYKEVRNLNADSVSWGSGTYEFYQSTVYGLSYPTSLLFNGIQAETLGGHWATNQYTSGTYNSQNHYIINDYFGDWVIIKLPLPVILTKFIFYRRDANLERRSPGAWKCYGSRDGVNFFEVAAASQTTKVTSYSSGSYTKIVTPQPVVAYQYYGWVVNKFLGSDNVLNFGELEFWAQEPPTYSTTTDASVCTSCTTCGEGETLVSACNTTSNAVCRQCQAGTYSQQGNCTACASGTYSSSTGASSSASCTACSAGTYSTASGAPGSDTCVACAVGTYMTEQGGTVCTACPASSTTLTTGRAQRGDCICNAGFFGNLADISQNCTACPANSFCAGLSQTACPVHTHSPAQSSLPIQCRCDAGYKCSYRRDASVTIRFDGMDTTQFTSQSDSIKAKLASTADVPVGNVNLVNLTQIL